jgi:hypothetical protein
MLVHLTGVNTTISHLDIISHLNTKQTQISISKHNLIQKCLQVASYNTSIRCITYNKHLQSRDQDIEF